MAYVLLIEPYHDRQPGDVIDVPAVEARDLLHTGRGVGGNIDTSNPKPVNYKYETPEKEVKEIEYETRKGRETITPKPLKGTIPEIKKWLDNHGVEYKSTARKPELLEILEDA